MGKTWFITGASRGFGRIWAEAALKRGDKVTATARKLDDVADLKERFGDAVLPMALDVANSGQVSQVVQQAYKHFGRLDVLVNNAGTSLIAATEEASDEQIRDLFVAIRSLEPGDDATAFRTLNEEWITRYFTLEAKDRETLNDPVHSILLKGGHIFMAYAPAEAVGCVALIPMRDGIYELSKMAVSPHLRGRGIGRRLLQHAIAQARGLDAKSLFLGSNTCLKNAVHLYESVGFRHVKPESLPPMPYSRADVFMEMPLG